MLGDIGQGSWKRAAALVLLAEGPWGLQAGRPTWEKSRSLGLPCLSRPPPFQPTLATFPPAAPPPAQPHSCENQGLRAWPPARMVQVVDRKCQSPGGKYGYPEATPVAGLGQGPSQVLGGVTKNPGIRCPCEGLTPTTSVGTACPVALGQGELPVDRILKHHEVGTVPLFHRGGSQCSERLGVLLKVTQEEDGGWGSMTLSLHILIFQMGVK